jgi:hypothetical protein
MRAAAGILALMLLWTNPPDLDLALLRFSAIDCKGDTIRVCRAGRPTPGAADSTRFALPCTSTQRRWRFYLETADSSGNWSLPSNVVDWIQYPLP